MENADAWRDPNPWHPMTDPVDKKTVGKFLEELGECVEALCTTERNDAVFQQLENEVADVKANIVLMNRRFDLASRPMKGLTLEQALGRTIAATARCFIQGIDECEPVTKKPNREWLEESIGYLENAIQEVIFTWGFDMARMELRISRKIMHLSKWHAQA